MGVDKSLRPLAGTAMIQRVADRLAPQVDRLAINANGDAERFKPVGLPVIADTVANFAGPLAGIVAGMRWAQAEGFAQMVTAATDSPFLPGDLTRRLEAAAKQRHGIVVARCDGRVHPVFALWPTDLADAIEAFLRSRRKASVLGFIEEQPHHAFAEFEPIATRDGLLDPFFNINTPADLDAAERIASEFRA